MTGELPDTTSVVRWFNEARTLRAENEALRKRERELAAALDLAVSRGCNHCAESIAAARKVAAVYPSPALSRPAQPAGEPVALDPNGIKAAEDKFWHAFPQKCDLVEPIKAYLAVAHPSPQPADTAISVQDPLMLLAGIKQFGLAPDGSDLRDLQAAIERLAQHADMEKAVEAARKDAARRCITIIEREAPEDTGEWNPYRAWATRAIRPIQRAFKLPASSSDGGDRG